MRAKLAKLQREYLIDMEDVVAVTKDEKGKVTPDKVLDQLKEFNGKILKTSLTADGEESLRKVLEQT